MLKEHVERSLLMGIGLISITREKAQALVEEMVKQGHAARSEAKDLTERLVTRGQEERSAVRTLVQEEVDKSLKDMRLATATEMEKLQAEIEALQAQLETEEPPEA